MDKHKAFLEQAIELAIENRKKGGRPFGAVLVKDGRVLATGTNNMLATSDPSSHAEMEAMRRYTVGSGNLDLSGCTIYASGQPCPMCLAAMAMTNVGEVVYAFDNNDSAPFNFSSQAVYDKMKIREISFLKMSKCATKYSAMQVYGEI